MVFKEIGYQFIENGALKLKSGMETRNFRVVVKLTIL